jgi:hypothetical protein
MNALRNSLRAIALGLLLPTAAHAQAQTMHFSVAAGISLPTGTFGDATDAGYHLAAALTMPQRGSPLEIQAEGTYNEFNLSGIDGKARAFSIGGNALYHFSPTASTTAGSFYGIGGLGLYNTRETISGFTASDNNLGWNLGAGYRFPLSGFSAYLEARYHAVTSTDVHYIPITFGLVF